jgi:hypothetical protein
MPGYLSPLDLIQMPLAAGYTDRLAYAEKFLTASPGAVVANKEGLLRIPTIIPRASETGACIHFVDGRCAVHSVSPFGCAFVDEHMGEREANRRSGLVMHTIVQDREENGMYWQTWLHLWQLGHRGPDLWPKRRTTLTQQAMQASTKGKTMQERMLALRLLTILTTGKMKGELPA